MTVFKFKVRFEGDDYNQTQVRFVLAPTEEQAIRKMEEYCEGLENRGFAKLHIISDYPTVEIDGVII